jgi:diguanylate cyclase (GGDEF)-like protein
MGTRALQGKHAVARLPGLSRPVSLNPTATPDLVASVRRLSTLAHAARSPGQIHDGLAEGLLALLSVDEVHLQHLGGDGRPELAVAYSRGPGPTRHTYAVADGPVDPGIEWVATTRRPLVAPDASSLPPGLIGRHQVAGAALLPVPVDGRVVTVAVLVSRLPSRLTDERLELAGLLIEIASTGLSLINARAAARTDTLTGLMNHGAMINRINEEIDRARRQGSELACLLIDLDDFKHINDVYGHLMGDGILRHVAETLRREFRRFDRVARYGGDEFVVILPNASGPRATAAATRALARLREIRIEADGRQYPLTASIGVGSWEDSESAQDLLDKADVALRDSKRGGKDRLAIVGP